MFSHLITFVLGFAAGCTFKELLDKKKTPSATSCHITPSIQAPTSCQNNTDNEKTFNQSTDFSLQSLKNTFDTYNVKLTNAGSFGILLDQIRSSCYKDILKCFLDKANTPSALVDMLKMQTTPNKKFSLTHSLEPPYISKEQIDSSIVKEGVSLSEFDSYEDKVVFLLSLYYAKGIDDFKKTLGSYMSDILSAEEKGTDITDLYENIMRLIRNRYSYIS